MTSGVRRAVLSSARVHDISRWLVGGRVGRTDLATTMARGRRRLTCARDRCGTGDLLDYLPRDIDDPAIVESQHPMARLLIARGRGPRVRTPDQDLELLRPTLPQGDGVVRDRRWVPHTHWTMAATHLAHAT